MTYSGFDYHSNGPVHTHDCQACTYLYTIVVRPKIGDAMTVDIYNACSGSVCEYLLRYSSEDSDYTTVDVRNALASYILAHNTKLLKNFFPEQLGGSNVF